MFSIGQFGLIGIFSHFIFIYITWRVLQGVQFEKLIKKGREREAQIFSVFLSIVIGAGVSRFVLDIVQWTRDVIFYF